MTCGVSASALHSAPTSSSVDRFETDKWDVMDADVRFKGRRIEHGSSLPTRTRLFLSEIGYEKALDSQAKGQIKILSHAKVRNGDLFYDHKEQIR